MIILKILEFASNGIVNFLITTFYLTIVAVAIGNFRLVDVEYIGTDAKVNCNDDKSNEE